MCYGMGCKYEIDYGHHELTGECSLPFEILGTSEMPKDATCVNPDYEGNDIVLGEYRNLGFVGVDEIQGESEVSHAFYLPKEDAEEVLNNIAADVDEIKDTLEEMGVDAIPDVIEMLVELMDKLTGEEK